MTIPRNFEEAFEQAALLSRKFAENEAAYVLENQFKVEQSGLDDRGWSLTDEDSLRLLDKLRAKCVSLGEFVDGKIYRGVLTGLNDAFVIDSATRSRLIEEDPRSEELIRPFLAGRDIKRYESPFANKFLIFIPKGWTRQLLRHRNRKFIDAAAPDMRKYLFTDDLLMSSRKAWWHVSDEYPAIAKHLEQFAEAAEKRYDKGDYWWELRACEYYDEFEKSKIMLPDISIRPNFTLDESGGCYFANTGYMVAAGDKYLLGVLNSSIFDFFYGKLVAKIRGGYMRFFTQYLETVPIRTIDFDKPEEKAMHDRMVGLVEQMIEAKKNLAAARADKDKQFYERFCEKLDREIDELVYQLYDITPDERKIIES